MTRYLRAVLLACLGLLVYGAEADAATIYTFDVAGTTDFDTSTIHSFSIDATELTFLKDIDGTSPDIIAALTLGNTFETATLTAYDTSINPINELFRYVISGNVSFVSYSAAGLLETVTLTGDTLIRIDAPIATPEPASMLLFGTGLAGIGMRRWKQRRAKAIAH